MGSSMKRLEHTVVMLMHAIRDVVSASHSIDPEDTLGLNRKKLYAPYERMSRALEEIRK